MASLLRLLLFGFVCLLLLSACGPRRGTIQGTVTYKKKPLTNADLVFIGKDGVPLPPVPLDVSGTYELKGVAYGDYLVALTQQPKDQKTPSELRQEWKDKGLEPPAGAFFFGEKMYSFPAKYADHSTSGLTVTVSQGATQFDISLGEEP